VAIRRGRAETTRGRSTAEIRPSIGLTGIPSDLAVLSEREAETALEDLADRHELDFNRSGILRRTNGGAPDKEDSCFHGPSGLVWPKNRKGPGRPEPLH
jgi:hypothetical protein